MIPPDDVATTIVSYEEQVRGWMEQIAQAKSGDEQVQGYRRLKQQLGNYCVIAVVAYDEAAAAEFEALRYSGVRIGKMDLKIAAIALAHNGVVLACNRRDFEKVPGLQFDDWTV